MQIPEVTVIGLTGRSKDAQALEVALEYSCRGIEFGGMKVILDKTIKNIDDWNFKIVFELWQYVSTSHAILIHPDGYIINPEIWNNDWLLYDYIGAPWPMPVDSYSYRDPYGNIIRVGNSVSLRSKKLMLYPKLHNFEWQSYYGNTNEDGYLCVHNRKKLEDLGCKFAPLEVAKHFSKEHEIPENVGLSTFAFHQVDK